jgi:hypothetical protein
VEAGRARCAATNGDADPLKLLGDGVPMDAQLSPIWRRVRPRVGRQAHGRQDCISSASAPVTLVNIWAQNDADELTSAIEVNGRTHLGEHWIRRVRDSDLQRKSLKG